MHPVVSDVLSIIYAACGCLISQIGSEVIALYRCSHYSSIETIVVPLRLSIVSVETLDEARLSCMLALLFRITVSFLNCLCVK